MTQEFPIGSVVKLKSGGPAMTVTTKPDRDIGGQVWCRWFASDDKRMDAPFPIEALDSAEPS